MSKKLIAAIKAKDLDKVKAYLNPDNINKPNINGDLPIHIACYVGSELIAKYLIENGADFDDQGYDDTPLFLATSNGMKETVYLLVSLGARLNYINGNHQTILHHAAFYALCSNDRSLYDYLLPLVPGEIKGQIDDVYETTASEIIARFEEPVADTMAAASGAGRADDDDKAAKPPASFKDKVAAKKDEAGKHR